MNVAKDRGWVQQPMDKIQRAMTQRIGELKRLKRAQWMQHYIIKYKWSKPTEFHVIFFLFFILYILVTICFFLINSRRVLISKYIEWFYLLHSIRDPYITRSGTRYGSRSDTRSGTGSNQIRLDLIGSEPNLRSTWIWLDPIGST